MKNTNGSSVTKHLCLVSWLAALMLPAFVMLALEIPLHIRAVTRVLKHLDPYSYFILLAVGCLVPSAILLFFKNKRSQLSTWQLALCCAAGVLYAPMLWIESLYLACLIFNDCYNI
jgi:hypothetical protein